MTTAGIDHALDQLPAEYPIRVVHYTRDGKEIVSHIFPFHEAKVLRAKAAA